MILPWQNTWHMLWKETICKWLIWISLKTMWKKIKDKYKINLISSCRILPFIGTLLTKQPVFLLCWFHDSCHNRSKNGYDYIRVISINVRFPAYIFHPQNASFYTIFGAQICCQLLPQAWNHHNYYYSINQINVNPLFWLFNSRQTFCWLHFCFYHLWLHFCFHHLLVSSGQHIFPNFCSNFVTTPFFHISSSPSHISNGATLIY